MSSSQLCIQTYSKNLTHIFIYFFFSSRRRHTRSDRDWSSDVCSSDLQTFLRPTSSLFVHLLHDHIQKHYLNKGYMMGKYYRLHYSHIKKMCRLRNSQDRKSVV